MVDKNVVHDSFQHGPKTTECRPLLSDGKLLVAFPVHYQYYCFDHRPFLYNVGWPWQFRRMDAAVAQAEGQQQRQQGSAGDGLMAAAAGPALAAGQGEEALSVTRSLKMNSIMKQFTLSGGGGRSRGRGGSRGSARGGKWD